MAAVLKVQLAPRPSAIRGLHGEKFADSQVVLVIKMWFPSSNDRSLTESPNVSLSDSDLVSRLVRSIRS